MVNTTTTRGADPRLGSTVDWSQLPLMRRCTASTYQENREPKSPPPIPENAIPAWVFPGPMANDAVGMAGVPPPPYGIAVCGGGGGVSSTLEGLVMYFGGLFFSNFGIGTASGGGFGGAAGSDLKSPLESSTTRLSETTSGRGSGIAGTFPTSPTVIEPPGPPQLPPRSVKYA